MSEIAKPQSLEMKAKAELHLLFPSYSITEAMDSAGASLLLSADSTPAAGEVVVAIRFKHESTQNKNSIGMDQRVYSPCVCQVIQESGAIPLATQMQVDKVLARLSVHQERYQNSAATVPTLSQFQADGSVSGSTKIADLAVDPKWPLSGQ